jgi:uncharacterized protein (DUF433 family)
LAVATQTFLTGARRVLETPSIRSSQTVAVRARARAALLDTVEYEGEIVRRWWPLGKDVAVLVDPDFGFGLPVVEGVGVRTEIIAERHRAGDSTDEIAYDFDVTPRQIKDALQWEMPKQVA